MCDISKNAKVNVYRNITPWYYTFTTVTKYNVNISYCNLYELYSQGTFPDTAAANYNKLVALTAGVPAVRLIRFVLLHGWHQAEY